MKNSNMKRLGKSAGGKDMKRALKTITALVIFLAMGCYPTAWLEAESIDTGNVGVHINYTDGTGYWCDHQG